jgi:hypothetical protein
VVLEKKHKRGSLGAKTSVVCDGPFQFEGQHHRDLAGQLLARDLGPLAVCPRMANVPVLFNHYQREYYVTSDRRVRLTIDTRLKFYDQIEYARFNHRFARPVEDLMVIELKADREHEDLVTQVANEYAFRALAFSKFSVGLLGVSHTL